MVEPRRRREFPRSEGDVRRRKGSGSSGRARQGSHRAGGSRWTQGRSGFSGSPAEDSAGHCPFRAAFTLFNNLEHLSGDAEVSTQGIRAFGRVYGPAPFVRQQSRHQLPDWLPKLFNEVGDYYWPDDADLKECLIYATSGGSEPPTAVEAREATQEEAELPDWNVCPGLEAGNRSVVRDFVRGQVNRIRLQGNPGGGYSVYFATNGQVIETFKDQLVETAVDRLFDLAEAPKRHADHFGLARSLLAEGLADTCTPFIKNEPHPSRKRGKERIVIAVSIVDQLVELALFGSLLDRVHGGYPHLGVISGIGFSDSLSEEFCGVYLTRRDE